MVCIVSALECSAQLWSDEVGPSLEFDAGYVCMLKVIQFRLTEGVLKFKNVNNALKAGSLLIIRIIISEH